MTDISDPVSVLQSAIESGWSVVSIPNVYYTGKYNDFASPKSAPDDVDEYCILDFGDAAKVCRTNISVIWSLPVTIKVFDLSIALLREKVTALKDFIGAGEAALASSGLTLATGCNLSEVACGRISYEQVQATKAKAEFEVTFRLVCPV